MKVHKENTQVYESLYDSLADEMNPLHSTIRNSGLQRSLPNKREESNDEKLAQLFQTIVSFEKRIQVASTINEVSFNFYSTLSQLIDVKESAIFLFDQNKSRLLQIDDYPSNVAINFVNRAYKEGMLDWVFESGKLTTIPLSQKQGSRRVNLNCIVIPIMNYKSQRGILLIFTGLASIKNHIWEFKSIDILLSLTVKKIETMKLKKDLKAAYHEMQTYQSKLSNDFRLSAIGELTSGIVEHIFSPLQVILTSADLLQIENPGLDESIITNIKEQIGKVKNMLDPLVKFAEAKNYKSSLQPCNINEIIHSYYNLIEQSLNQKNYECILDLESEIPSIISDSSAITQLMTNLFTLLKSETQSSGGILIQTKHQDDFISLRVISTDYIPVLENYVSNPTKDLSILMMKNIMKKHNGTVHMETNRIKGSNINLLFPLKRTLA